MGIECDGAQYHSSKYARDRDKIRQGVLESLGWHIHRIWSEDWLNDREHEVRKIKDKIEELKRIRRKKKEKIEKRLPKVENVEDFHQRQLASDYPKYVVADLSSLCNLDIEQRFLKVIEVESPIDKELLYRRILKSYGISKLGKRIEHIFESVLSQLFRDKSVCIDATTVSGTKIMPIHSVRVSTEEQRPFTLIPKEELAGTAVDILRNTYSISKEALVTDVAREVFGNKRTGSKIRSKMDRVIAHLIAHNLIEVVDGKVQLIEKDNEIALAGCEIE